MSSSVYSVADLVKLVRRVAILSNQTGKPNISTAVTETKEILKANNIPCEVKDGILVVSESHLQIAVPEQVFPHAIIIEQALILHTKPSA